MYFLFNRTTLLVFVTYVIGALYVHPLWFYKHQHDNRVRSKLFVACLRWWFQWRFWFVPSVPGYLREEHKPDPWRNPIERNHIGLHLENEVARRVVKTPTIIFNNPVLHGCFLVLLIIRLRLNKLSSLTLNTDIGTIRNQARFPYSNVGWNKAVRFASVAALFFPWMCQWYF